MKTLPQLLLLTVLCLCTFFVNLGSFEPDLMEARNFIAAREMVEDGHWLIPTMNGELRLEKPPLPTWMTAASALLGGGINHPYTMRFPAALMAMAMVFFMFGLVRQLSKDKLLPLIAAGVLATSLLTIQLARTNSWDIYAQSFMLGAIWLLVAGLKRAGPAWKEFAGAGVLVGLSIMSKGPVAPYGLLLPFLVAYAFGFKSGELKSRWKELLLLLFCALLVSVPWNAYIFLEAPEALGAVASKETGSWANRHVRPFYFYLHFPIYSGLWTLFVGACFVAPYAKPRINQFGNYRFLLIWLFFALVLLSVIPTKKERYLIPVIIPMALMVATFIRALLERIKTNELIRWDKVLLTVHFSIVATAAGALPFALYFLGVQPGYVSLTTALFLGLTFLTLAMALVYLLLKKRWELSLVGSVVTLCLGLLVLPPFLEEVVYKNPEYKSISQVNELKAIDGMPWYTLNDLNMKVIWEAGGTITRCDSAGFSQLNFPVVFFSDKLPEIVIPASERKNLSIELLDDYDYFRKKNRYRMYVSILKRADQP